MPRLHYDNNSRSYRTFGVDFIYSDRGRQRLITPHVYWRERDKGHRRIGELLAAGATKKSLEPIRRELGRSLNALLGGWGRRPFLAKSGEWVIVSEHADLPHAAGFEKIEPDEAEAYWMTEDALKASCLYYCAEDPVRQQIRADLAVIGGEKAQKALSHVLYLEEIATALDQAQRAQTHALLKRLGSYCDRARRSDYSGFNAWDSPHGHYLARVEGLSPIQAAMAWYLVRKYRKQLPVEKLVLAGVYEDSRLLAKG